MARLTCSRHGKRVQVINVGNDTNPVALTVHRNSGKRNEVCDSRTVTIDGERFTPEMVIADDWSDAEMVGA